MEGGETVSFRSWRPAVAVTLLLVAALAPLDGSVAAAGGRTLFPASQAVPNVACDQKPAPGMANQLLADRYGFPPFPTVKLPEHLTWAEDPFDDLNWQFQLHSLWWLLSLTDAWQHTGRSSYLDRALEIARSWVLRNPRNDPPSRFSWNDHSTALRAIVLTCVAETLPRRIGWLEQALTLHGRTLADRDFYVRRGNHALNQNIGLLEIGCWQKRRSWISLATHRINVLLPQSVDAQGVTNEGSVGYQRYNWERYRVARHELRRCGQPVDPDFARINKMPAFLAYATRPDGAYETIGDTRLGRSIPIEGTIAEYTATLGAKGPRPRHTIGIYDAGYIFGRTGWGTNRPYRDENFFSLRFGGRRIIHGQADGSSVTLYGRGREVLVDPGYESYNGGRFRAFFKSQAAHNVLLADGYDPRSSDTWKLTRKRRTDTYFEAIVELRTSSGLIDTRRVIFSRRLGFLIVEDRAETPAETRFHQLWHLPLGAKLTVAGQTAYTHFSRGNVLIQQLLPGARFNVVEGETNPMQGWLPTTWGNHAAAPVLEDVRNSRRVKYATLLVPYASDRSSVQVTNVNAHGMRFSFDISIDGRKQHVQADGLGVVIANR
jgi:hypothetical protein